MVKFRTEISEKRRRHALMLAGTLLTECDDDDEFQMEFRAKLRQLFEDGLKETMACNNDIKIVQSILTSARSMQLGDFGNLVDDWIVERLRSSLVSQQPLATVAEVLQQSKELPGFDGRAFAKPLEGQIVSKCTDGILLQTITATHVNWIALFETFVGPSFNHALFDALEPSYDSDENRAVLTEWLVAYCEHTGIDIPPYCMNSNQADAFE